MGLWSSLDLFVSVRFFWRCLCQSRKLETKVAGLRGALWMFQENWEKQENAH